MTKNIVEAQVSFKNADQVVTERLPFHYVFYQWVAGRYQLRVKFDKGILLIPEIVLKEE